jgi:hypothetical protein
MGHSFLYARQNTGTPWTYPHNTMDKTDIAHASNQYVEKLNIVLKTLRKQQI